MCSSARALNYGSNPVLCCQSHNSKYKSVPNNDNCFYISCVVLLCCKYRWGEMGLKFSLRTLVFMFAWTKGFSKHWEREIAIPLKIRGVSICLSNLSCYAVKTPCPSIERNGRWKVCVLGCTTLVLPEIRRSWRSRMLYWNNSLGWIWAECWPRWPSEVPSNTNCPTSQ